MLHLWVILTRIMPNHKCLPLENVNLFLISWDGTIRTVGKKPIYKMWVGAFNYKRLAYFDCPQTPRLSPSVYDNVLTLPAIASIFSHVHIKTKSLILYIINLEQNL